MPRSVFLKQFDEMTPGKPKWTAADIPDLTGKVYIVTGGNTGIGYVTVKELLNHGAKVYLAARSRTKSLDAIQRLQQETNVSDSMIEFLELELSNLTKVKASARDFLQRETRLDALINNAGVMVPPVSQVTAQGYDLQFGVNAIALYLFSSLLTPLLISTASSSYKTRIVNVSSSAHLFTRSTLIDYETLKTDASGENKKWIALGTQQLYNQSKSGAIMLSMSLARSLADRNVVVTSLNPGGIKSDLQRHMPFPVRQIVRSLLYDTWYGAITQLHAATAPEAADYNGKYLIPWARVGEARDDHYDVDKQEELRKWLDNELVSYL